HYYITPLGNVLQILLIQGRLCVCLEKESAQETNDNGRFLHFLHNLYKNAAKVQKNLHTCKKNRTFAR
ncbi:MAG: hypothetical protein ACI4TV_00410, partial [Paludibacteraceae bacterium]